MVALSPSFQAGLAVSRRKLMRAIAGVESGALPPMDLMLGPLAQMGLTSESDIEDNIKKALAN